jgi:enoyl-CoA hydratase/carnithine racemase
MEFETLLTTVNGALGYITLNRPAQLNALSRQMLQELARAARWFDSQREVKVVIIKGLGRAFSAGADLANWTGDGSQNTGLSTHEAADLGRQMAEAIEAMRAVTIAQVQGHCVGGGVVLVAACDLRVAAANANFFIPEVDLGIPLAWGGIPRLVREIGAARTKELVLTCRPFSPAEGLAMGFLNRVVPPDQLEQNCEELAALLVGKSALTLTVTKRHVNAVVEGMVQTARSFADADALTAARQDPESLEVAAGYLRKIGKTK